LQLAALARIQHYKEDLARHRYYGASDMFAEFDEGKKGYVTLEDFTSKIAQELEFEIDAARFFELSGATEKGLTYRQFETALTGSSSGR